MSPLLWLGCLFDCVCPSEQTGPAAMPWGAVANDKEGFVLEPSPPRPPNRDDWTGEVR
jgi:hypothetical protein